MNITNVFRALDPWLNVTYKGDNIQIGGRLAGDGSSTYNAFINSGLGALRPYISVPNSATLTERIMWGMFWESNLSGGQSVNNVVNP